MKVIVLLMLVFALCDTRYIARGNGIQKKHLSKFLVKSYRHFNEDVASNRPSWFSLKRWKRTANEEEEDSGDDSFGRPVKIRIRISRRRGKVPVRDYLHLLESEDDGQDDGELLEQPLRVGKKLKPMLKNLKSAKPDKNNKKKNKNKNRPVQDRFLPGSWIKEAGRKSAGRRFQQQANKPQRPVKRNEKKKQQIKKQKKATASSSSRDGAESDIGRELSALAEWFLRDDAAFDKILQETMSSYRRGRQSRHKRKQRALVGHRKRISLTFKS